jgi:hypothetical protein
MEQQKESLYSHELCTRPWEKIGCGLFGFNQQDYLMTVDYYSDYFEIDRLNNKKGKEVIGILKKHFATVCFRTMDRRSTVMNLDISQISMNLLVQRAHQDFHNRMEKSRMLSKQQRD